jgi:hypothetical protein
MSGPGRPAGHYGPYIKCKNRIKEPKAYTDKDGVLVIVLTVPESRVFPLLLKGYSYKKMGNVLRRPAASVATSAHMLLVKAGNVNRTEFTYRVLTGGIKIKKTVLVEKVKSVQVSKCADPTETKNMEREG